MQDNSNLVRRGFLGAVLGSLMTIGPYKLTGAVPAGSESLLDFIDSSGDAIFDRVLASEFNTIAAIFKINPGFKYVKAMNVYFINQIVVTGTTDGTVLLGLPLINNLMQEADGLLGVTTLCAHECGHIYQFKKKLNGSLELGPGGVRRMELHADFLAGYCLGKREFTPLQVSKASRVVAKFGDYLTSSPDHQGTPTERAAALLKGYSTAMEGQLLDDAANVGTSYVLDQKK